MSPTEISSLILSVLTIVGILMGALGWWINMKIKAATYQIQPNFNGGKSLADLHRKVDTMGVDIVLLKAAVLQIEEDIEELQ